MVGYDEHKARKKAMRIEGAARNVLALEEDLEALLRDLKAEGLGRARCFLQALQELRKEVNG
jgi:hypothetical protein